MERNIHQLFSAYLQNDCTKAEIELLLKHFDAGEDEEVLRHKIRQELAADYKTDEIVNRITKHVDERIFKTIATQNTPAKQIKNRRIPLYLKLATTAAAFLLIGFIWMQWGKETNDKVADDKLSVYTEDVLPGKQNAQLVLSNGETIALSEANASLKEVDGTIISGKDGALVYSNSSRQNNAEQLMNTLLVPKAGIYHLILPDGTQVWLNSASSITFPTKFESNSRQVSITGEAYFEVAHNKNAPFEINVHGKTIKVLGTHFNVRAYDEIKTTLFEGSVQVSNYNNSKILLPGEEALIGNDNINIYLANIAKTSAWRDGKFYFTDESITAILEEISRWYDVKIDLSHVKNRKNFSGTIKKNLKLSEVLNILNILTGYDFELQNKKVSII